MTHRHYTGRYNIEPAVSGHGLSDQLSQRMHLPLSDLGPRWPRQIGSSWPCQRLWLWSVRRCGATLSRGPVPVGVAAVRQVVMASVSERRRPCSTFGRDLQQSPPLEGFCTGLVRPSRGHHPVGQPSATHFNTASWVGLMGSECATLQVPGLAGYRTLN